MPAVQLPLFVQTDAGRRPHRSSMKANLRLAGVSLIAVVVITFISTSSAWPHTDHHRLHDTVRQVTPISSARSGSSLNHNRSAENKSNAHLIWRFPKTFVC